MDIQLSGENWWNCTTNEDVSGHIQFQLVLKDELIIHNGGEVDCFIKC